MGSEVDLPLWKMMEFVSCDGYSKYMENKIHVPNHQPAKFLPLGYSQPKTMYVCFHSNVLLLKVTRNISNTLLPAEICRNVDYFLNMKHVEHCRTISLPWLSLIASVRCEGFSRDIPPNQGFWWYPVSCSDRTTWPHGALTVNICLLVLRAQLVSVYQYIHLMNTT